VDGEEVILESSLIIRYLDDLEPGLTPATPLQRYRMNKWIHRIDQEIHPVAATVTFALGPRRLINSQPEEVREAGINKIIDPTARAKRRSVLDHGIEAPEFKAALIAFVKMLDDLEAALDGGDWLAGSDPSLADGSVLPYVLRLSHLGMDPLIEDRAGVAAWFARMQARPSFEESVGQWMPPEIVAFMRANGEEEWPGISALLVGGLAETQETA
jgi:glutathione S-transferase